MIKESKYCADILKKHFDKEFVMIKKDNEHFKNSDVGFVIMSI